jgi:methyl-accepting chemotaxis protein
MSGVSILIALLFIASIGRSISRPLAELKEVTARIGKRDLSTSADINRHDDIGQLADAINRLRKLYEAAVSESRYLETEPSACRKMIRNTMEQMAESAYSTQCYQRGEQR